MKEIYLVGLFFTRAQRKAFRSLTLTRYDTGRRRSGIHSRYAHISSRHAEDALSEPGFRAQDCNSAQFKAAGLAWPVPRHRERDTGYSPSRYSMISIFVLICAVNLLHITNP